MRTVHLFLERDENRFVVGLNAANPAGDLTIAQNDTLELVIHALVRNAAPARDAFSERPLDFTSIRASIGTLDAAPTGGTFKLRVGGGASTAALPWPAGLSTAGLIAAWKASVLAALVAIAPGVELLDGATTPAHFFYFRWTDTGNTAEIEVVENKLSPYTDATILPFTSADGGLTHLVKLVQFPAKIATDFGRPTSPLVTVTETRAGATGTNAEQTLYVPTLATGSFSLGWDGASTKTISAGTVTAAAIAAALNAIVADGATAPRFRCEERTATTDGRRFAVEFIGALAGAAQSLLTIAMHDQASLPWAVGTLDLAGNVAIEMALAGAESVDLTLELVITTAEGEETFLRTVTLANDMTGPGTLTAAEDAGAVVTFTREVFVDAGLGTSFAEIASGTSFAVPLSAATNVFNFTHNLGEWQPQVRGFYKASISPEEWIQLPDDRYEARSTSVNVTRVTLPFNVDITTPSAETYASRYKFFFAGNNKQVQVFTHQHSWDEILETVPDGQTLALRIAAIDAAIAALGGGATLQGAAIADGTVSPDKLDLTALATAMFANAKFLELLRLFGADETFITKLFDRLNTSSTLLDVRAELLTALLTDAKTNVELQTALLDVLKATEGFQTFLLEQVIAALAGGSQIEGHLFTMPDVDIYSPPPTSITLSGIPHTEYRGLPIAYQSTTNGGNVSGALASPGTVGARYTCTAAAFAPEADGRPAQTFASGDLIIWNGNFYQLSVAIGTAWYPKEYEQTIIETFMDELRFPIHSILTLNATLQTQLDTPAANRLRARWRVVLEVGAPTSEAGELNLNSFTWTNAGNHTLQLGPELCITPLQIVVTRGVLASNHTWAFKVNGRVLTAPTPVVVTGSFAFRVRLTQFDIENNTTPRGAVRCKVKNPGGLIVASS